MLKVYAEVTSGDAARAANQVMNQGGRANSPTLQRSNRGGGSGPSRGPLAGPFA